MQPPSHAALQAIWRDRIHVQPGLLEALPRTLAGRYPDVWAPAQQTLQLLEPLPESLLDGWARSGRGHVLLTPRATSYLPGPQPMPEAMRPRSANRPVWEGLCQIAVAELATDARDALDPIAHWLDHLLGNDGRGDDTWFADGAGATPQLAEYAARFQRIATLGYGRDALGAQSDRDYFARALWLYARAPQELNVLDPPLHRLYREMFTRQAILR